MKGNKICHTLGKSLLICVCAPKFLKFFYTYTYFQIKIILHRQYFILFGGFFSSIFCIFSKTFHILWKQCLITSYYYFVCLIAWLIYSGAHLWFFRWFFHFTLRKNSVLSILKHTLFLCVCVWLSYSFLKSRITGSKRMQV